MNQHTLKTAFTLSGKGLHTGIYITAIFKPAPENYGIKICRTDLNNQPTFEAVADYVGATERGTVLSNGDWKISTVEHALSALYAMNIDNCLIEINGPEMPILDGSAEPFIKAITQSGVLEQQQLQKCYVITEPIHFKLGQSTIDLLPDNNLYFEVNIKYNSPILNEQQAILNNIEYYPSQIAPARTFVFVREIQPLLKIGLIKGGDLKNALVIYDQKMEQSEFNELALNLGQKPQDAQQLRYLSPLKFTNEPAKHKLLDLIGDLSLLGMHIQGKIIASCPGHTVNTTFCKQLRKNLQTL